jgi:outer membrane protein OmpA-like peptidoglycan-associated protein
MRWSSGQVTFTGFGLSPASHLLVTRPKFLKCLRPCSATNLLLLGLMEVQSMKAILSAGFGAGMLLVGFASAQPVPSDPQPIYRVTVISRNLEAVNYEHRGGPTPIDFQGTVLLPHAKGTAIVESHRGSVAIDAKFEHLDAPTRFGREYLTYVLWAISPEGRTKNLGEVLVDSSNKAHVKVTTDLQAFGLMVTAEPYFSVSLPSDVVVAENLIRPDTIGTREEVTAKYELLPRGEYTLTIEPSRLRSINAQAEALPYDRYEALLELYQAENALQIARSLGADRYAPDSFNKAAALLTQAQDMNARRVDSQAIVSNAREAAQMAEDARIIAVKRRDEERHLHEIERLQNQSELRRKAEEDAAQARAQADAEAQQAAAAREDARLETARARAAEQAALAAPPALPLPPPPPPIATQQQFRAQLLAQLNGTFATRDTPRGLVVTVTDSMFASNDEGLRSDAGLRIGNVAAILSAHPELSVRVEGYGDAEALSEQRAQAVRGALIGSGARPDRVAAAGYGNVRPIASNATAAGREQNRRVEVVIYGNSIGNQAVWDHPYPLRSQR